MTAPEENGPSADTRAAAAAILDHCDLVDVRTTRIFAELSQEGPCTVALLEINPTLEYFADTGQFSNRFSYSIEARDELGRSVANLEFTLVLDWSVPNDFTPDHAAADFVAATTGYFAAYPYAREIVHTLSTRLGIDPIVLGALRREALSPAAVTIALRPLTAETLSSSGQRTMSAS
jgi:hypothetical protein